MKQTIDKPHCPKCGKPMRWVSTSDLIRTFYCDECKETKVVPRDRPCTIQPEVLVKKMLKYSAAIVLSIIICVVIYYKTYAPRSEYVTSEPPPQIYIINTREQIDFYDNNNYIIQYAINGQVEHAVFSGADEGNQYINYLKTIGTIYSEQ